MYFTYNIKHTTLLIVKRKEKDLKKKMRLFNLRKIDTVCGVKLQIPID